MLSIRVFAMFAALAAGGCAAPEEGVRGDGPDERVTIVPGAYSDLAACVAKDDGDYFGVAKFLVDREKNVAVLTLYATSQLFYHETLNWWQLTLSSGSAPGTSRVELYRWPYKPFTHSTTLADAIWPAVERCSRV